MVLHDVLWPYGRRDLYYAPEQIPEEFRQPYAEQGMRPGTKKLLERGGLNPTMYNALEEGGPRNGVMTARRRLRRRVRPPAARRRPADLLRPRHRRRGGAARTRSPSWPRCSTASRAADGRQRAARGRRGGAAPGDDLPAQRLLPARTEQLERAQRRYLDVVKAALLNEHYLDHEVRFEQLAAHVATRPAAGRRTSCATRSATTRSPTGASLRNRLGPAGPDAGAATSFVPYTAMGRAQLDHLERCLDAVRDRRRRRRPRRGRDRPRRRRHLHARLPRRPRGRRTGGCSSPTASAPPRSPSRRPTHPAATASPASAPTSTSCATASSASICSTTACGSSRARWPRRSATPGRRTGGAAPDRSRAPAREVGAVLDALLRPDRRRRLRRRRRPRRVATCRNEVDAFRAARGITAPLEPVDAVGGRVAQGRGRRRRSRRTPRSAGAGRASAARTRRHRPTRSTSPSSSSSTTCGARRRARCTRCRARTRRTSTTSTTR